MKKFEKAEVEICLFEADDVICTSGAKPCAPVTICVDGF